MKTEFHIDPSRMKRNADVVRRLRERHADCVERVGVIRNKCGSLKEEMEWSEEGARLQQLNEDQQRDTRLADELRENLKPSSTQPKPIGLTKNFVIYDESDQQQVVKGVMRRLGLDDKQLTPRNVLSRRSE